MEQYRLENDVFIIEEFDKKPPFCSFLPGLAGEMGIPLWSFYTNRGQAMTSFGYNDKNNPIMEYFPANIAYENTTIKGFRTFIRKNGHYFEPFFATAPDGVKRNMYIKQNSLKIVEKDDNNGVVTTVEYFILPNEPVGAIVRRVTVENTGDKADFELLDGMPRIIAYGMTANEFTRMAYLMRSYFTMLNIENKIPVFLNRISGDDDDEVKLRTGGYFYLIFDNDGIIEPIYDPIAVFGEETSLVTPLTFEKGGLNDVYAFDQIALNKICCSFAHKSLTLNTGEKYSVCEFVGYTDNCDIINKKAKEFTAPGYVDAALATADKMVLDLTDDIASKSGEPIMDMYARQSYLDNFLRGGYPYTFGDKVIHIFSRRHGDPERDYNFFSIAGEYFSQGDGNFRDVSQNRRNDVIFHPECGDFNIWMFFSLMQFDGYNPLFVKGTTFSVKPGYEKKADDIIRKNVSGGDATGLIKGKFTAGELINGIYNMGASLNIEALELLGILLPLCEQNIEASTDKYGYWSDHWDYNMDLVEAYMNMFPDKLSELLFDNNEYLYFDSDMYVNTRADKYFFDGKAVRQFKTFELVQEKYERGYIKNGTNWLKTEAGDIYKTNLAEKLISLCVNKFALLDQGGMGIEMEVGKSGWCDSCNGLPSQLGSGLSETFELKRLMKFTTDAFDEYKDRDIEIPEELCDFYAEICEIFGKNLSQFDYWDAVATAREKFRLKTKFTITGGKKVINLGEFAAMLHKFIAKLDDGIERAVKLGGGLCPTYLRYKATDYDILDKKPGNDYPNVRVRAFEAGMVPHFLEGPAKHMTNSGSVEVAKDIFNRVKSTDIYDEKLGMYKTSGSIEAESHSFGRLRAFTPGWHERESVFVHMEYKYLLAMLNAGIYDIFFDELKRAYIPFQDPAVYGRSILENSSFIVTTVNPDPTLHGKGFMARLTGATTEATSIWVMMFLGRAPFSLKDGELVLTLRPILPKWMFDENGEVEYNFIKSRVKLHNSTGHASYDAKICRITVDGAEYGDTVTGDVVHEIRDGKKCAIDIYYE